MAKVLVATYTNFPNGILDPFRQAFIDALVKEGNDVLLFKTNDFIADYTRGNQLLPSIDKNALSAAIKEFDPHLFFSFNHAGLFAGLHELLECPLAIWLVDGPAYVADPGGFRKHSARYHIFSPVKAFAGDLIDDYGLHHSQFHYLPFCSDFQNVSSAKMQNISFIGTFFEGQDRLKAKLGTIVSDRQAWSRARCLFESYQLHPNLPWTQRLQRFRLENIFDDAIDEAWILNVMSTNDRIKTLEAVEDLGLSIYGTHNWLNAVLCSLKLTMAYDPRPVLFKQDLENIYNASYIALNVSHAQERGGLPWRVFDVMASGAALVTGDAEDLKTLFGDIDMPAYKSPSEARSLCQSLLSDETKRKTLVASCNDAIESAHRFKHRLASIGETVEIDLLAPKQSGKCRTIGQLHLRPAKSSDQGDGKAADSEKSNGNGSNSTVRVHKPEVNFPIEVFYSDDLTFSPNRARRVHKSIAVGEPFVVDVKIEKAPEFIRFDIGSQFSHHRAPKLVIVMSQPDAEQRYQLDFKKDVIEQSQLVFENDEIICGYDPWCVFRNPFKDKNIVLHFESILLSGI